MPRCLTRPLNITPLAGLLCSHNNTETQRSQTHSLLLPQNVCVFLSVCGCVHLHLNPVIRNPPINMSPGFPCCDFPSCLPGVCLPSPLRYILAWLNYNICRLYISCEETALARGGVDKSIGWVKYANLSLKASLLMFDNTICSVLTCTCPDVNEATLWFHSDLCHFVNVSSNIKCLSF